ncbi:hypothetical protein CMI47_12520 [Candidatus Pacearchaeota archaeon]|nr:hypothetical protein [Candidatus Pacearchaeota archaeon]
MTPLGSPRNGEPPLWKLLRLWPLVIAVVAVVGSIYNSINDIGDLQAAVKIQWGKISDNEDQAVKVDTKVQIIQFRLDGIEKSIVEQNSDIKAILKEVSK